MDNHVFCLPRFKISVSGNFIELSVTEEELQIFININTYVTKEHAVALS